MIRQDLLDLSTDSMIVLSNVGLVKRATKDVAADKVVSLTVAEDGLVTSTTADGAVTALPQGAALRDATCTCTASGVCRHRIMLVLAYQSKARAAGPTPEASWDPRSLSIEQLKPAVLVAATRAANLRPTILVDLVGRKAKLPRNDVLFLSGDIQHARCDCREQFGCEHVALAVWAFQQAPEEGPWPAAVQLSPLGPLAEGQSAPVTAGELLAAAEAFKRLSDRWWASGTSQPSEAYERELAQTAGLISEWPFAAGALGEVQRLIAAQLARSSLFEPVLLLDAVAACWGRLRAARMSLDGAVPLPSEVILGIGAPGESIMDRQRLVSLGGHGWRSAVEEGVQFWLADTDTGAILQLDRSWPLGAPGEVLHRRMAGNTLTQLMGGQVLASGARRLANGKLELPRAVQATPLSTKAWRTLRPPVRTTASELLAALTSEPPAAVKPPGNRLAVLELSPVEELVWGFDAIGQRMFTKLCSDGIKVELEVLAEPFAPQAFEAVAEVLHAGLTMVAGQASMRGDSLRVRATALASAERVVVPAIASAKDIELPEIAVPLSSGIIESARATLAGVLRQGLRNIGLPGQNRLARLADELAQHGFQHCAEQTSALAASIGSSEVSAASEQANRLATLLLQLSETASPDGVASRP